VDESPRRIWVLSRGNWLHRGWPDKPAPLIFLGGDEWGNRPLCVRLPGRALLCVTVGRLKRHRLPHASSSGADGVTIYYGYDLDDPTSLERVGPVLVNYGTGGDVLSVVVPEGMPTPDVVAALRAVLPAYVVDATVDDLVDTAEWQASR
jgi:hypothetical protein